MLKKKKKNITKQNLRGFIIQKYVYINTHSLLLYVNVFNQKYCEFQTLEYFIFDK